MPDKKSQAKANFGKFAQNYVQSKSHASGHSLDRFIELLPIRPDARVLDIATGGGHTALRCAQTSEFVVASDLTPRMLQSAKTFHSESSRAPIKYVLHDAEKIPFQTGSFEIVTCRIAAHHFPDIEHFLAEASRVLAPGGWLGIVDIVSPESKQAARYCNAFETLRDPSHVWAYSLRNWKDLLGQAGLELSAHEPTGSTQQLGSWARRMGCDGDTIARLRAMLLQAPEEIRAWYGVSAGPGWPPNADISFTIQQAIMTAQKARYRAEFSK